MELLLPYNNPFIDDGIIVVVVDVLDDDENDANVIGWTTRGTISLTQKIK